MADRQAPADGFRGEREECLPSDSQEQRVTFALQVRLSYSILFKQKHFKQHDLDHLFTCFLQR